MDPLSITASIAAVLSLTGTLTGYINDIRHATAEQKKIALEASNLYSLLWNLRFRVEEAKPGDPWFSEVKLLAREGGPLGQLQTSLESIVSQTSSSTSRGKIKSALTWSFNKSDLNEALQRIERLKSLIQIALTDSIFNLSRAIRGDVIGLQEQVGGLTSQIEGIRVNIENLGLQNDKTTQNNLSEWLKVPDPSINFQTALEKRHVKTGSWLLNSQTFRKWKTSASACLMWLHGNVGCGKTVLSATALQEVMQWKTAQPEVTIAYFYFDFSDSEKQSCRIALRSLLFQLALQSPQALPMLMELYEKNGKGSQQPPEAHIRTVFRNTLVNLPQTYIILDALDECVDCEELIDFFRDLLATTQHRIRVLATSRCERHIQERLNWAEYVVNIQSAVVDEDIGIYVSDRLVTDDKLRRWPKAVKEEIIENLKMKADGMFRWAYCQLELLRQCVKLNALRKALSSLPVTLDDTYTRIIKSIDSRNQLQDALKVLQWLCYSERPMRLSEMVDVLAIGNEKGPEFSIEERLPDPLDIMVICSNLISCVDIDTKHFEDDYSATQIEDKIRQGFFTQVQLAHFSVKEYLLSDRCVLKPNFEPNLCHKFMTEDCLQYIQHLCAQATLSTKILDDCHLYEYAVEFMPEHASKVDEWSRDNITKLVLDLLRDETRLLAWAQIYDFRTGKSRTKLSLITADLRPQLYYAAWIGLKEVVRAWLKEKEDKTGNKPWSLASSQECQGIIPEYLDFWAKRRNEVEILRMLLNAGADVNAEGGNRRTALQAAVRNGNVDVVQLLLNAGADVNAEGGDYENALQAAAYNGDVDLVQLLLDAGADVNAQGPIYGNALQAAAYYGNVDLVQLLRNAGADVNAAGGAFENALQAAAYYGNIDVVQRLLNAGADVNAEGGVHGNALQAAAYNGNIEVVQQLLVSGAVAKAQSVELVSALHEALQRCDHDLVRLLLDVGVDMTSRSSYGSALHAAASGWNVDVVKILIDLGLDINDGGGKHGTPLQAALSKDVVHASRKHPSKEQTEVVKMLLDAGADVNLQGGKFGSPLHAASFMACDTEIFQLILDTEVSVNTRTKPYGTALQAAMKRAWKDTVACMRVAQLLLNAGADVNAQEGDYGTALQMAVGEARTGDRGISLVKMLLDAGADVNANAAGQGRPLQIARTRDWEDVIQILIEAGAEE